MRSTRIFTLHQLWSNFWALPSMMILGSVVGTGLLLVLDARAASVWMEDLGWPFALSAKTAQPMAAALVTLHTGFSTLYFSITLLVLTLAGGNLGVRLIDRWISDLTIRFTLGLLMSLLAASLVVLFSLESDGAEAHVPRLTLSVLTAATLLALGWMTKALHHLGRTVHIDTSIARLGQDAAVSLSRDRHSAPSGVDMETGVPIAACETGYMDEINRREMLSEAAARGAFVRLTHAPGDFMISGEQIGTVVGVESGSWVNQHISCAQYRNELKGAEFECNLLVEIAARALSPGINDLYTALACCDRLVSILAAAMDRHDVPQWLVDKCGVPRLELPRERVTKMLDGPLKTLRRAAVGYPSVVVHLIQLIARLPSVRRMDNDLRQFLLGHVEVLAEHATTRAEIDSDRAEIELALSAAKKRLVAEAS